MNARQTFSDIRNYLVGQFVGATRDESVLAEVIKCLFAVSFSGGAFSEQIHSADSIDLAKHYRAVFKRVTTEFPDLFDQEEELLLGPDELAWTIRSLSNLDIMNAESDLIGDAYEIFIGSALRGQEGQFFTPRNAIDFLVKAVNPSSNEKIIDPACGSGGFLASCLMSLGSGAENRKDFQVFGIDKDASLVRLAKIHLALLGADYQRVFNTDSIAVHNGLKPPEGELPVEGEYDVVLTNPPFGARIISAKPEVALKYELARKWKYDRMSGHWYSTNEMGKRVPPQVLFLEKCVRLLRPGGRCGMVVPESLMSSNQYRYVADYLMRNTQVKLVAGMPESLFKTSGKGGTHTKTCLLVFEKPKNVRKKNNRIFFAEAKWCGNDSRGKTIDRDDIAQILDVYQRGPRTKTAPSLLGFWIKDSDIEDFSLSPRRYDPTISDALDQLRESHEIVRFGDLVDYGAVELRTGDEVGKLAYGGGNIPFIRTSDISNWEIKADPKHGLSEDVYNGLRDKQDICENDLLMVKDGTYLIGTCALITRYDLKMVYQSHLFKIRVNKSDNSIIDPFLLLAVLSSDVVQNQIRSKRVTHDIIDSLGARIADLQLPLPKSKARRRQISTMVSKAISERVEARELTRKARELVLS